jgi:hypothetical protein
MAKIADSKGRPDENSGYARLFGNQQLGHLISRVQATVIRTGNELEHLIEKETPEELKASLDDILVGQNTYSTTQVIFQAKMPPQTEHRGEKADIVIFNHHQKSAMVIELKDGDTFDTKKSSGELESMTTFVNWITSQFGYKANFYFCCFNQNDKQAIVAGAKGRFDISHAMTGQGLCEVLQIDYDKIREKRQKEQPENLRYFIVELLKINDVQKIISEIWNKTK